MRQELIGSMLADGAMANVSICTLSYPNEQVILKVKMLTIVTEIRSTTAVATFGQQHTNRICETCGELRGAQAGYAGFTGIEAVGSLG